MPAVITVGMVAGGLLIVTFCVVFLLKRMFPPAALGWHSLALF
jgi:hypothetical protein